MQGFVFRTCIFASYRFHLLAADLVGLVRHSVIEGVVADDKDEFLLSELCQIGSEGTFGLFIQIAPRFVQQDAGGVTEQGAGQINFLLFTKGKVFRLDG